MTKVKKLVAAFAAVVAAGAISVTAFASADKPEFYFSLVCGEKGGVDWSGLKTKNNNDDPAVVQTEQGYVSESSYIYISIYDRYKTTKLTGTEKITSPRDTYYLDYDDGRGKGSENYLRGNAGYYSADVSGHWEP